MNKEIKLNLTKINIKNIQQQYPDLILENKINSELLMSILSNKDTDDLKQMLNYTANINDKDYEIKQLQYKVIETEQEFKDYKITAFFEIERLQKEIRKLNGSK